MSSVTIAIQAHWLRHTQSGELRVKNTVHSERAMRRHVVWHNRNPSLPAAVCTLQRIMCRESTNSDLKCMCKNCVMDYFQGKKLF